MVGKAENIVLKYFPRLNATELEKLLELGDLYKYWNERINVVSRKDIDKLYLHHVLHALAFLKFERFDDGKKVLDVGTGGGFPGIPLAICFPDVHFHLIDGRGKKIKVVNEIAASIGLKNLTAAHTRLEDHREKYDYILGRAVKEVNTFVEMVLPNCISGSTVYYWTGDRLKPARDLKQTVFEIHQQIDEGYFLDKFLVKVEV